MKAIKNYWRYVVYALIAALLIWPTGRIFIQRQLMKIGFFQPKLEGDLTAENNENDSSVASVDKASFSTSTGEIINTVDLKGKVVFINFWATWCGPCIAEMPSIEILYNKYKDNPNVVFLIVEVEGNVEGAEKFLKNQKLNLPIVYPNSDIPQNWLSGAIPSTVILNKMGLLAERKQGMYDYSGQGVQDYIQSLIDQK